MYIGCVNTAVAGAL